MYFLYIYVIMKELENRLIVIPKGTFKNSNLASFVKYIMDINKIMKCIDNDTIVKNTCEQVILKNNRIKQFNSVSDIEFHADYLSAIESNGTNFLIFKN